MRLFIVCFKCKSYKELVIALNFTHRRSNILSWTKFDNHIIAFAFNLLICNHNRCKICHCRTQYRPIHLWIIFHHLLIHLTCTLHINAMNLIAPLLCQLYLHWTCNKRNIIPCLCTYLSKCKSHFSSRIVTYKTHRVYPFVCRTRRNQYFFHVFIF